MLEIFSRLQFWANCPENNCVHFICFIYILVGTLQGIYICRYVPCTIFCSREQFPWWGISRVLRSSLICVKNCSVNMKVSSIFQYIRNKIWAVWSESDLIMASQKYSYFPAVSSESNKLKPAQTTDKNGLKRKRKNHTILTLFGWGGQIWCSCCRSWEMTLFVIWCNMQHLCLDAQWWPGGRRFPKIFAWLLYRWSFSSWWALAYKYLVSGNGKSTGLWRLSTRQEVPTLKLLQRAAGLLSCP